MPLITPIMTFRAPAVPACIIAVLFACALVACGRDGKVIARVGPDAHLLGALDGRVYWRSGASISWMDDGLREPKHVEGPDLEWAERRNFAMDSRGIYFSHRASVSFVELGKRDRDDAMVSPGTTYTRSWTRPAGEHPTSVVLDGRCVYSLDVDVSCTGHGAIMALPTVEGASCTGRDAPANGSQFDPEFRMDAAYFYWIDVCAFQERPASTRAAIKALPRGTGEVVTIAEIDGAAPRDLQIGTKGLYWRTPRGIQFAPSVPFGPPSLIVEGNIRALSVDHGSLFYLADDGLHWFREADRQSHSARKGAIRDFVVDERNLYELRSDGQIARSPRPDRT